MVKSNMFALAAIAAILVLTPLANGEPVSSAKKKRSGIYGKVMRIGFPPDSDYMGMSFPCPDVEVLVYRASDGKEVKTAKTNRYGGFNITLPPGKYIVEPLPLIPSPKPEGYFPVPGSRNSVTVWGGFYTEAEAVFDGGW